MGARGSFKRPTVKRWIKGKGDPDKPFYEPPRLVVVKGLKRGRVPRKSSDPRLWEMAGKVVPGSVVQVEENEDAGRALKRLRKQGTEGKPDRRYS